MEKTNTATRENLLNVAKEKARAFYAVDKEKATAAEYLKAQEDMNEAVKAVNADMVTSVYSRVLATEHPVAELCKTYRYTSMRPHNNKGAVSLVGVDARLSLLDFLTHCNESGATLDIDTKALVSALDTLATELEKKVRADITKEAEVGTKELKSALETVINLLNVEGVHARSKDARYLAYVATKAKRMGVLADITAENVVPFLMDIFKVQLRKEEYMFEKELPKESK